MKGIKIARGAFKISLSLLVLLGIILLIGTKTQFGYVLFVFFGPATLLYFALLVTSPALLAIMIISGLYCLVNRKKYSMVR